MEGADSLASYPKGHCCAAVVSVKIPDGDAAMLVTGCDASMLVNALRFVTVCFQPDCDASMLVNAFVTGSGAVRLSEGVVLPS